MDSQIGMKIIESLDQSLFEVRSNLGAGNWVIADRHALIVQEKLAELEELLALTCDGYVTLQQVAESKLRH